jgi:hypothetical protein
MCRVLKILRKKAPQTLFFGPNIPPTTIKLLTISHVAAADVLRAYHLSKDQFEQKPTYHFSSFIV